MTVRRELSSLVLCGLLVAGILGYGSDQVTRWAWLDDCEIESSVCDGHKVNLALVSVREVKSASYIVSTMGQTREVATDHALPLRGSTVSVRAEHREGRWVERERYEHSYRWLKSLLGILGLLLLPPFLVGTWRFARPLSA